MFFVECYKLGIFTKNEPLSESVSWILFIPIWPIWVWGFWRIQSLRRCIPVILGAFGISIVFQMLLPFPYGLLFALIGNGWIVVIFHRRWTKEWNAKFQTGD